MPRKKKTNKETTLEEALEKLFNQKMKCKMKLADIDRQIKELTGGLIVTEEKE